MPARICLREPMERTGSRPHGVRLAAEIEKGNGTRIVQVVPGLSDSWGDTKERERFLDSRIRPDGTCELALDPMHPERDYLLPRFDAAVWAGLFVFLVIVGWIWWQSPPHASPALAPADETSIERPR